MMMLCLVLLCPAFSLTMGISIYVPVYMSICQYIHLFVYAQQQPVPHLWPVLYHEETK